MENSGKLQNKAVSRIAITCWENELRTLDNGRATATTKRLTQQYTQTLFKDVCESAVLAFVNDYKVRKKTMRALNVAYLCSYSIWLVCYVLKTEI